MRKDLTARETQIPFGNDNKGMNSHQGQQGQGLPERGVEDQAAHQSPTRVLIGHFFQRFFANDTLQVQGDTLTTVVRALAIVAVPGLMVAFFLQNQYPRRSLWGSIEDQYFFVLFSFVAMGGVAIFEWEMLFPDRLDFLILSPLSLKPVQMLMAKAAALGVFLLLFLFGANVLGTFMLPIVSYGHFLRHVLAHGAAVGLAGAFAALFFVALGGVLLCVLPARQFRAVSPLLQMLAVTLLALLMVHYGRTGSAMQAMLAEPLAPHALSRWLPPLWFLGVYEHLLHGSEAPAFAADLARYAVRATLLAASVAVVTYPLAWARMRRLAIEGTPRAKRQTSQQLDRLAHRLLRRPGERAMFHFIGQTMARNNHYQVYLAMYGGTGLALAAACATTLQMQGAAAKIALSEYGLHAVLPLLLFWLVAGLRTAFAFPLNLSAGWVFRVTGVHLGECAGAARRWVFLCAAALMVCVLGGLCMAGWDARQLLVQAACGLCLCVLLIDGFFFAHGSVPFNQPRLPGKTNLPLMLTLYVGVLPIFLFGMIRLERALELHPWRLLSVVFAVLATHRALSQWRKGQEMPEEEHEGYEGEFQLLGLSFR